MQNSSHPIAKHALRGLSWLLFVVAGLLFWVGGRAISEFAKVERILAEFMGLLLAAGFTALGAIVKSSAGADEEDDETPSSGRGTL